MLIRVYRACWLMQESFTVESALCGRASGCQIHGMSEGLPFCLFVRRRVTEDACTLVRFPNSELPVGFLEHHNACGSKQLVRG